MDFTLAVLGLAGRGLRDGGDRGGGGEEDKKELAQGEVSASRTKHG